MKRADHHFLGRANQSLPSSRECINNQELLNHNFNAVQSPVVKGGQVLEKHNATTDMELLKKNCVENPAAAKATLDYALTLFAHNRIYDSIQVLRKIVAAGERHPYVLFVLAYALTEYGIKQESNKYIKEAVSYYTAILSTQQDNVNVINNLGMCFLYLQNARGAGRCFVRAIQIESDNAIYYNNLALVARLENLPEQSVNCCRKAIELNPGYPEAYNNLGNALKDLNDLQGASVAYEKAAALHVNPDFKCNLAAVLLAMGDFKSGWKMYEYRKKPSAQKSSQHPCIKPQWKGEEAPGKTLLIYSEQGFGDTLQFCRYVSLAHAKGLRVVLQVPKPLARLLQSVQGVDAVVTDGQTEDFDYQCPMLSLPLAFQTDLDSIPSPGTYLFAADEDIRCWENKMAGISGLKIGLVWSGQTRQHSSDFGFTSKQRSMPAECFLPLMDIAGIRFFNLQKDGPQAPAALNMIHYMDQCHDFADTAALIMHLDLVITVDTAVAHLAGALGKPVWVLNRYSGCWRWLRGRDDSPWYPSLRLFTQTTPGDWGGVIARVRRALEEELGGRSR